MADPTLAEIRAMPEAELVRRHDELGPSTSIVDGLIRAAYVSELDRRAAGRSARATTTLSVVAIVVSVASLIVGVFVR